MSDDCPDCQEADGTCQWAGCKFPADYVMRSVRVRRQGALIIVGDVDLCGGHHQRAKRLGELSLDWDRVLRAVS